MGSENLFSQLMHLQFRIMRQLYLTDCMKESQKSLSRTIKYLKISPKSDSSLSSGIPGIQMTSFQSITQCLLHINQYITHFCETCDYKPLCGLCLQEGTHKTHSVKNVEKTSKIVQRVLTQTLISIRAKVNLLQILEEHVTERQNEVRQQLKDYIESINNCFDELENCIEEKKKEITKVIQQFYKASAEKLIEAEQCAKEQIEKLQQMIKVLSWKAQKLDSNSLCLFYYEKKDILQGIMEEGNFVYESLKKLAPDLKWDVNPELFQPIKTQINSLGAKSNSTQIQIIYDNVIQGKKKNDKKDNQKSLLKNKSEKRINSNTAGFLTPKHVDSSKLFEKLSNELKQSCKLLTEASSQSIDKTNPRVVEATSVLLKKVKNRAKFDKNI